jgi:hypothetical protein
MAMEDRFLYRAAAAKSNARSGGVQYFEYASPRLSKDESINTAPILH